MIINQTLTRQLKAGRNYIAFLACLIMSACCHLPLPTRTLLTPSYPTAPGWSPTWIPMTSATGFSIQKTSSFRQRIMGVAYDGNTKAIFLIRSQDDGKSWDKTEISSPRSGGGKVLLFDDSNLLAWIYPYFVLSSENFADSVERQNFDACNVSLPFNNDAIFENQAIFFGEKFNDGESCNPYTIGKPYSPMLIHYAISSKDWVVENFDKYLNTGMPSDQQPIPGLACVASRGDFLAVSGIFRGQTGATPLSFRSFYLLSSDRGKTWAKVFLPPGYEAGGISLNCALSSNGTFYLPVWRRSDGSYYIAKLFNGSISDLIPTTSTIVSLSINRNGIGIALPLRESPPQDHLYITVDDGITWNTVKLPETNIKWIGAFVTDTTTIFLTAVSHLAMSTDKGKSWKELFQ